MIIAMTLVVVRVRTGGIENCEEYYKNENVEKGRRLGQEARVGCEKCIQGFFAAPKSENEGNYFICYECPKTCVACEYFAGEATGEYSEAYSCSKCAEETYLSPEDPEEEVKHTCEPCLDGCKQCSDGETCSTCKNKYYIDEESKCENCVENCKSCQNGNSCDFCSNGFFKKSSSDPPEAPICRKCLDNCIQCFNREYCYLCKEGYHFDKEKIACKENMFFKIILYVLMGTGGFIFFIIFLVLLVKFLKWKSKRDKIKRRKRKEEDKFIPFEERARMREEKLKDAKEETSPETEEGYSLADKYKESIKYGNDTDWEEF